MYIRDIHPLPWVGTRVGLIHSWKRMSFKLCAVSPATRGRCKKRLGDWCHTGESRAVICRGWVECVYLCVWACSWVCHQQLHVTSTDSSSSQSVSQRVSQPASHYWRALFLWARVTSGGVISIMRDVSTCSKISAVMLLHFVRWSEMTYNYYRSSRLNWKQCGVSWCYSCLFIVRETTQPQAHQLAMSALKK